MSKKIKIYNAESIQVLEGLEAVRIRPGMYIGSTNEKGLNHLVWEIIDNAIDESLEGYADEIKLEVLPENVIRVTDNGRGIPVDIHPKTNKTVVETILTTLHAGGKFDNSSYKISGGLHGVGASVVNALSSWFLVEIHLKGKLYFQKYEKGKPVTELEIKGNTDKKGTVITFLPDNEIFKETTKYNFEILKIRMQQLAFLNKGIKLIIIDKRKDIEEKFEFHYKEGLKEYIKYLNKNKIILNKEFYQEKFFEKMFFEIVFQYTEVYNSNIYSFVNNIPTHDGGTHEEGFKMALNRILNKYVKDKNMLKKNINFISEDTLEGLTMIISLKHPNPSFESQTKTKFLNSEVRQIISKLFGEELEKYLLENPQEAKKIIEKCLLSSKARMDAKKAREATRRKSPLETLGFASKLADCYNKNPKESELYIVEGDSAGGSAKQGRDSKYQAILPLKGKVLNVEKARLEKILSNKEIISLIQAVGTGFGKDFNIEKVRYHRIIIMTDADVDGAHIRTLLLTFFFRNLKPLIEKGYIYFAKSPLYKIQYGKKITYAYEEQELKKILSQINSKFNIQRYKGLGEMNPEQLWETTMNPETRTLLQVNLEDDLESDKIFNMLMGEEVSIRKEFIQNNAVYADLDV
ncbi:DNA topoisomerase (ATP-hydrolyzing) subunit B [Candidatus Phytoplasma prunorum]|uniref:DNA topoisomerase (ATP-hydrolyzing) subunit B n=1 Tax=Candidatus Phytoplasma prunorum TaxID=47565 RepID=UPI002FF01095